jgi:hypothetical protein
MFTDKLISIKTSLTPSDETKLAMKVIATQLIVGIAVSVVVRVATDQIVKQLYSNIDYDALTLDHIVETDEA